EVPPNFMTIMARQSTSCVGRREAGTCPLSVREDAMGARSLTVVVGAGSGGVVAARRLRDRLPAEHRVLVVDARPEVSWAPGYVAVVSGGRTPQQITKRLSPLPRPRLDAPRPRPAVGSPSARGGRQPTPPLARSSSRLTASRPTRSCSPPAPASPSSA